MSLVFGCLICFPHFQFCWIVGDRGTMDQFDAEYGLAWYCPWIYWYCLNLHAWTCGSVDWLVLFESTCTGTRIWRSDQRASCSIRRQHSQHESQDREKVSDFSCLGCRGLAGLWMIQDCWRMLIGGLVFFRLSITKGHFPKLAECAHFHYDNVEFGTVQVKICMNHVSMSTRTVLSASASYCIWDWF